MPILLLIVYHYYKGINMKKKGIFLTLLSVFLLSMCLTLPVMAYVSPCGWSALPMTDNADDVYQYNNGDSPWDGTQGAFHPEIDIRRVFLLGGDLYIEFDAPPQIGANYQYTIYIDVDDDAESEYVLISSVISYNIFLLRESDGLYWNGTGWSDGKLIMQSISGNNLTFQDMDEPLPTYYSSAKYAVALGYIGELPTVYSDYAPLDPSGGGGIPGFAWIFTCFGIIAILGLLFLQKRVFPSPKI
jgi:hypothetical protein